MVCWRICKRRYASPPAAAFDGEGSRRRGGRWSPPGLKVAYASCSLALAAMEYFVNLSPEDAPEDLVSLGCEIPDAVRIERVSRDALPPDWRSMPYPTELQHIGERWFIHGTSVCLLVPSAVIPGEQNALIHSEHPDFRHLLFSSPLEFCRRPDVEVGISPSRGWSRCSSGTAEAYPAARSRTGKMSSRTACSWPGWRRNNS